MLTQLRKPKVSEVSKKTLFLNLAFKGNSASEVLIESTAKSI